MSAAVMWKYLHAQYTHANTHTHTNAFAHRRPGWQTLLILNEPGLLILVFHFSNTLKNTDSLPPVTL
jgi:hypothetical protein